MKALAFFLFLTAALGQTQAPFNRYWDVRGVGVDAAKPATCVAQRHVYLCVGSGCSPNPSILYCTATNTWTAVSGGSGAAVWGGITGTLGDQSDLASALAGKEPTITTLSATKGGLGANAGSFSGVIKMSGGVASVVAGGATDCVLVDGTSGPCGTGGGGVAPGGMVKEFSTPATSWTFPASEHLYESCAFDVVTWLQDGDYLKIVHHSDATCQTASGEGQWDVVVTFENAQAGKMGLIPGGSPAGSPNLTVALDAVTTIDIEHNYGTKAVLLATYDASDNLIEPDSAEHLDENTMRVTFTVAQSGYAVLNRAGWHGDVTSGGGGGGDTTSVQNSGAGAQVLKTGTNVTARTLVAGANVELTQSADTITIASTGGGGGGGTVTVSEGLLGDGSVGDPLRVNPATVPTFITASATINDWGTIGAAACVQQTFVLSGALGNDAIIPRWPAALPAGLTGIMFVSANNTIAVRVCNPTGSGIALPNGNQFGVAILRSF